MQRIIALNKQVMYTFRGSTKATRHCKVCSRSPAALPMCAVVNGCSAHLGSLWRLSHCAVATGKAGRLVPPEPGRGASRMPQNTLESAFATIPTPACNSHSPSTALGTYCGGPFCSPHPTRVHHPLAESTDGGSERFMWAGWCRDVSLPLAGRREEKAQGSFGVGWVPALWRGIRGATWAKRCPGGTIFLVMQKLACSGRWA